jgi:hypothetical protein
LLTTTPEEGVEDYSLSSSEDTKSIMCRPGPPPPGPPSFLCEHHTLPLLVHLICTKWSRGFIENIDGREKPLYPPIPTPTDASKRTTFSISPPVRPLAVSIPGKIINDLGIVPSRLSLFQLEYEKFRYLVRKLTHCNISLDRYNGMK